jgi:hypothetical protein
MTDDDIDTVFRAVFDERAKARRKGLKVITNNRKDD